MKRLVIALAAGIIAATSFHAPEAEAGGRFGFHFSPVFIPKPHYNRRSYRRDWYEDRRYARRQRRLRAIRRHRAAIERRKRIKAQHRATEVSRKAAAQRRLAKKRAQERARVAAAAQAAALATAAIPPPLPTKKKSIQVATRPIPTEALLTRQEEDSSRQQKSAVASSNETEPTKVSIEPQQTEKPAQPAELGCKKFLPSAGITISVPCSK